MLARQSCPFETNSAAGADSDSFIIKLPKLVFGRRFEETVRRPPRQLPGQIGLKGGACARDICDPKLVHIRARPQAVGHRVGRCGADVDAGAPKVGSTRK